MANIFLSYAREDESVVVAIERALIAHGLTVWRDRSIAANERFEQAIRRELNHAEAVIVCWTPAASASEFVEEEADTAKKLGKYVGCLVLPTQSLPMGFNRINSVELTRWNGDPSDPVFLKLLEPIGRLIKNDRIANLYRAWELAESEKSEACERKAAAERAQVEATRRREQIAQDQARERQNAQRQQEERRRQSFQQRVTPFLRSYYWWNPTVAALVLSPYGILLFYIFAWLLHGFIVGTQKTYSRLVVSIVLLWVLALIPTIMAAGAHMSRGPF